MILLASLSQGGDVGRIIVNETQSNHRSAPERLETRPRSTSRRRLLQAGIVGGTAVWAAPVIESLSAPAAAASVACSPAGTYTLTWASYSGTTPTALNQYPWTTTNIGTSGTAIKFSWSGTTTHLIFSGAAAPDVNTGVQPTYQTGRQTGVFNIFRNGAAQGENTTLTLEFTKKVRNLSFSLLDIDDASNFIDVVTVSAFNGGVATSGVYTPTGGGTGCGGNTTPSMTPAAAQTGTGPFTFTGTNGSADNCARGNLSVSVAGPVDQFVLVYGNNLSPNATTQHISISNIQFSCV